MNKVELYEDVGLVNSDKNKLIVSVDGDGNIEIKIRSPEGDTLSVYFCEDDGKATAGLAFYHLLAAHKQFGERFGEEDDRQS